MTVAELKNNITKNIIEKIYLFAGSEIGEKNEIIKLIEKKLFGNEQPTKYTFYCDKELNPQNFIDTLNSNLLFSDNKLVILKTVENIDKVLIDLMEKFVIPQRVKETFFENNIIKKTKNDEQKKSIMSFYEKDENNYYKIKKLKDADVKKIIAIFENIEFSAIPDGTYIIMINETNDKIPTGLTNLLNQKQNIIFWEMFDNQKHTWIRSEFKKYELYIEDNAIDFIINTIENNKQQFENEIQKISMAYPGIKKNDKNVVTKDILEEFLYHSKEETAFSLYSAILQKNLELALDILNKLFYSYSNDEVIQLLNGILWSHKRFLKMVDLYENESKSPEEIFSSQFINSRKAKEEYSQGFKNYSFKEMAKIYYDISELDYYLKVLPKELKLIKLQEFVIKFISNNKNEKFLSGNLVTFME